MISRQSESFSFLMIERKEFVMSLLLARHKLRIFFFFFFLAQLFINWLVEFHQYSQIRL